MSKNEKKHSTIKEIRKVKLSELKFAQYNPRSISEEAMAGLRASIRRFGIVDLIVMNERTGNVVGGHQRIKAAIAEGITESDIVIVDLPESEEKVLNVTLNNPHIQGEFVGDMLEPILEEIREEIGEEVFEELALDDIYSGKVEELEDGKTEKEIDTSPQMNELEYRIIVDCDSETHQSELLLKFEDENIKCRALIS